LRAATLLERMKCDWDWPGRTYYLNIVIRDTAIIFLTTCQHFNIMSFHKYTVRPHTRTQSHTHTHTRTHARTHTARTHTARIHTHTQHVHTHTHTPARPCAPISGPGPPMPAPPNEDDMMPPPEWGAMRPNSWRLLAAQSRDMHSSM